MTDTANTTPSTPRDLYLDLMKKCLTHSLWDDKEENAMKGPRGTLAKLAFNTLVKPDLKKREKSLEEKVEGRIWPQFAHTMIGFPRLNNLQSCVQRVIE